MAFLLVLSGCRERSPTLLRPVTFLAKACNEVYRVQILEPATIALADSIVGMGQVKVVTGTKRSGDGGFNAPWSWHLEPGSVTLVDATIELCQLCPSVVEGTTLDRVCLVSEILEREP